MVTTALPAIASNLPIAWLRTVLQRNQSLVRFLVLASLLVGSIPFAGAEAAMKANSSPMAVGPSSPAMEVSPRSAPLVANASVQAVLPEDGLYKFGQVPVENQVGAGYIVFESLGQEVIGALYLPSSSFDCFQGEVSGQSLAMTITNSYTQEAYPYMVALQTDAVMTAGGAAVSGEQQLEGFYQLSGPDSNDLRILEVCKANF